MANLNIGDQAPPFSLRGVDYQNHALSDYDDKTAIAVIFSCNHCPYVQAWEGRMKEIQADYGDKGIQLIAINANDSTKHPDDDFPSMQVRANKQDFNFPYLHDATQQVAKAYGAERTPEVFLFDGEGKLVYHGTIDDNYENPAAVSTPYLRDAIDALLAGNAPDVINTPPVGCTIKWK